MTAAVVESSPGVLIVDDKPANLLALSAVLHPLGVRVVEAKSGAEAIDRMSHDVFAVVLLDVQLPDMDGFEVARRMRQMPYGREVPIIFLTAIHRDEAYVRHGYAAGAADYITKPLDADIVRARVKAFVDLFHQRERLRAEQVGERTQQRDQALAKLESLLQSEHAARIEAEIANRTKDEFLATMSHELRTPLTAILGWAVIGRQQAKVPEIEQALAIIERNARAQMRLIEDLLDVARVVGGKLDLAVAPVEAADAIRKAVLALSPSADVKGVEVTTRLAPDLGTVVADADRLQQVVSNVVSNAIKFTPRGGRVDVDATRTAGAVVIEVRDTGAGISPAFLPFVFETFRQADGSTTRRHGGLGLGLSIVKYLVEAHGGKVTARSEGEGKGASFIIELSADGPASGTLPKARPSVRDEEARLDGLRVLLVDDDPDGRELFTHVLVSHGAVVTAASDAEEALRVLDEATEKPQLIVSDVAMPGMDGYELIRKVRSLPFDQGGGTPSIAVTAHAGPDASERAFAAGFQSHVSKPVDPFHLLNVVARLTSPR